MLTPDHEPQPIRPLLPVVSRETMLATVASFQQEGRKEAALLEIMRDENEILVTGVCAYIFGLAAGDFEMAKSLIMATTFLYSALRSQAEADSMAAGFNNPAPQDPQTLK